MARQHELRVVELVDADVDAPPQGSRQGRLWLVAGAVGVVLALLVAQGIVTVRENAVEARLARLPGVVSPVGDTLEVVRTLTPQDSVDLTGEPTGELLRGDDGVQTYRWVEPAADGPGWTTQLLDAYPGGPDGQAVVLGGSTCASGDEHVVCVVTDSGEVFTDAGSIEVRPATSTELVVLRTADGSVVTRSPIDLGTSVAVLPGDVAVVGALTDDLVVVTAYDALTGRLLWTHEEPWRPARRA